MPDGFRSCQICLQREDVLSSTVNGSGGFREEGLREEGKNTIAHSDALYQVEYSPISKRVDHHI